MTSVGADGETRTDFKRTVRHFRADTPHDAVLFNQSRHLGFH